jgi:hypothetical protein
MASTDLQDILLPADDHASRPAATAVAGGTLYPCTDHSLIYQSDGATWSTWATLGAGGIAATLFDAKGDLIAASAADTAARLAVGANDTILMADSGQSTGLKYVGSQTPTTLDYDDVAAEGTADTYSRGDHRHGMPAEGGGGGGGTAHEDFWTEPDTPGTYDEEFAGTADTLPTNWSWTTEPTGSNNWKLNSTWKRTLMIERAGSDTTTFDLRRTSLTPGAVDCGFWWYMDIGLGRWNNNQDTLEVLFRDSTGNSGHGLKILKGAVLGIVSRNRTGGTTSDVTAESAGANDTRFGLFCGVTRKTSDNTWRAYISWDGRAWETLGVSTTNSFTIDHMRLEATSGNNQGVSRIFFGPLRSRADLLQWAPR